MKEAGDGFFGGDSLHTVEDFRVTKFQGMLLCGIQAGILEQCMYPLTERQFTSRHCCVPSDCESDQGHLFTLLPCAAQLANDFRNLWLRGPKCES